MENNRIAGKTLRWKFDDGPMAGKAFEHVFGQDGSVAWRMIGGGASGKLSREKKYQCGRVTDEVFVVSYLGTSGYTLTCVLDFGSGRLTAIASNEKELVLQHGSFEPVDTDSPPAEAHLQ